MFVFTQIPRHKSNNTLSKLNFRHFPNGTFDSIHNKMDLLSLNNLLEICILQNVLE